QIQEILTLLRDDADLQYNFFSECLGVDYMDPNSEELILDKPHRFEVVYNLYSLPDPRTGKGKNTRIFIKVGVPEEDPTVPTVTGIYAGAEFQEREIYGMFGIHFSGHPDMRRILKSQHSLGH